MFQKLQNKQVREIDYRYNMITLQKQRARKFKDCVQYIGCLSFYVTVDVYVRLFRIYGKLNAVFVTEYLLNINCNC